MGGVYSRGEAGMGLGRVQEDRFMLPGKKGLAGDGTG